jgi:cholesterol transport system auxiliary component
MKTMIRFALAVLLGASLGGCALLNVASEPAPQLFTLTVPDSGASAPDKGVGTASLIVGRYASSASVDTARIVYQPNPNELQYYKGARWTDLAPGMVQGLTVQVLENSGAFAAVTPRGSEIRGDFLLQGDLRQFAAVKAEGGTEARVDIFLRLVSRQNRGVIAARNFTASAPVSGSGMSAVVDAFDSALGRTLADISAWTVAEVAKVPLEPRKPRK